MTRALLIVLLGLVVTATVIAKEALRLWELPLNIPDKGYLFSVNEGESLSSLARRLGQEGVLPHPHLFVLAGRLTGRDTSIKHGEYLIPSMITADYLLDLFESGAVVEYQVTFPEGITLRSAMQILAREERIDSVLTGPQDAQILAMIKPYRNPEGLFFPDSYRYSKGATDLSILRRSHEKMLRVLNEEWEKRSPGLPYDSPYEALIMASVVEKETGIPQERGKIAGVFVRRLLRDMRLQTDPTVIYGIGEAFDGNLKRAHLQDDGNVYNTYQHSGLPPSPIALAGREAIHAALHPEPGEALYFVARGDGSHYFSASLKEHQGAVRKYQLSRRKDYRSTPGEP